MLPDNSLPEQGPAPEVVDSLINDSTLATTHSVDTEALRSAFHAEQRETWHKDIAQWRQETESDAELGGAHLSASVVRAQRALQYFDPDRRVAQWLDQSGLGNHVEVLRFFNRIAKSLGDDAVAVGQASGSGISLEDRMYPNWKP